MKKYELHFNKINQTSRLYKILKGMTQFSNLFVNQGTCVNISFGDIYDEYFSKLSKSTRQNIRTAHNRLNREGKIIDIETHIGYRVTNMENKRLMKLYQKRSHERNGKSNVIVNLFQPLLNPLTHLTPMKTTLFQSLK